MLWSPDGLEQFAAAVDDLGMVNEIGGGVHHPEELEYSTDAVKTAERANKCAEHGEADLTSCDGGIINRHALADLSLDEASIFLERQMTRQIEVSAVNETRLIKAGRLRKRRQREAE